jgi:hypothetical protein
LAKIIGAGLASCQGARTEGEMEHSTATGTPVTVFSAKLGCKEKYAV